MGGFVKSYSAMRISMTYYEESLQLSQQDVLPYKSINVFLKEWAWEQRDLLHTVHLLWYGFGLFCLVFFLIGLPRKRGP